MMWQDTVFAGACAVLCGLLVWVAYQDLDDDQDDDLYVFGGGLSHPSPNPVPALPPVQVGPELSAGPRPTPDSDGSLSGSGVGRTHDVGPSVHGLPEIEVQADEPEPEPALEEPALEPAIPAHWLRLADCESGDWIDGGKAFVEGSARWDWGAPDMALPPWGTSLHHGGLQFAPSTWEWVAGDLGLLDEFPHAYDAPPVVQVEVAEEVQARQTWAAWPTCGPLVGLGG